MKKIIVASKNPVKISATKSAFERMFPNEKFTVDGVSVDSGVPDQPFSEEQTLEGAMNRANNAKKANPDADFYVGMEGGLIKYKDELRSIAWMYIISKDGKTGKGRTGTLIISKRVSDLVLGGMELGEADEIVFKTKNIKTKSGGLGILTQGNITRKDHYEYATILALIPFVNPELY